MRQKELIEAVAARCGLPKGAVQEVLAAFTDELLDVLGRGETVGLHGLGRFRIVLRAPRALRSIADHRKVLIGPRHAVRFRPAQRLRDRVATLDEAGWQAPGVQAAWRAAEVMLADLELYHGDRRPDGLRAASTDEEILDACAQAFGPVWQQVLQRYDAKLASDQVGRRDLLASAARRRWAD